MATADPTTAGPAGASTTEPSAHGTPVAPPTGVGRLGVMLYLSSDVMLFAAFFAAWYLLRSVNSPWPPDGVHLDTTRALVAPVVLVSSSATMVLAERALKQQALRNYRIWTLATFALGLAFLLNQLDEYRTLPFQVDSHVYGSTYWGLTGLHTLHVAAGLCALLVLFFRATRVAAADALDDWTWGISAYWHLVDVIWVAVFVTIWVIG
ncbi:MAG: heme-copper oxidase subunit III [Acidimicrobiales bacterium]